MEKLVSKEALEIMMDQASGFYIWLSLMEKATGCSELLPLERFCHADRVLVANSLVCSSLNQEGKCYVLDCSNLIENGSLILRSCRWPNYLKLPLMWDFLVQPHVCNFILGSTVSSEPSEKETFLHRLWRSQLATGSSPLRCTRMSDQSYVIDVME